MKKKIFIIDGPDGSGKTTLAKKLSDIYNIPILHLTYYSDPEKHASQFTKITDMIKEWIKTGEGGFIVDRYILSELVYHNVYRPDSPLIPNSDLIYEFMEHRAAMGEINIIIALPEDRKRWLDYFKSLEQTREEMYSSEKMLNVYEEYLTYWKKLRYNNHVMRYDLFENMEGQNKGKIQDILDDED